jgi:hypothetical protein
MYNNSGSFSFGATSTGGVESTFFNLQMLRLLLLSTQIYRLTSS